MVIFIRLISLNLVKYSTSFPDDSDSCPLAVFVGAEAADLQEPVFVDTVMRVKQSEVLS